MVGWFGNKITYKNTHLSVAPSSAGRAICMLTTQSVVKCLFKDALLDTDRRNKEGNSILNTHRAAAAAAAAYMLKRTSPGGEEE